MFEFSLKNQNELSRQSNSYKLFNYCDYYENYKFNYYKNYKFKNRRQPDNICIRNKISKDYSFRNGISTEFPLNLL